jgi:hypothetical protein
VSLLLSRLSVNQTWRLRLLLWFDENHTCNFELQWAGSGGPKGAQVISELIDWEVRATAAPAAANAWSCIVICHCIAIAMASPIPASPSCVLLFYMQGCAPALRQITLNRIPQVVAYLPLKQDHDYNLPMDRRSSIVSHAGVLCVCLQDQDHACPTDRKLELPGEVMRTNCQVLSFHSVVLHLLQDQDYNFPMDRKVELPDDVMRTKTFVLHATTIEQATESLEQVRTVTCYCSSCRFDCFVMRRIKTGALACGGRCAPCLTRLAACLWAKLCA